MLRDAVAAFEQILSPPFRRVLWKSLALSVALLLLGYLAFAKLGSGQIQTPWPWLDTWIAIALGFGLFIGMAFLVAPVSALVALTGLATVVLAPFGGYALCLSAITAAICMGREAHEDPERRYTAAVCCGALYTVVGLFGGAVAGTLTAFPKELVAAIAGLALLGTIGNGLATALTDEGRREAALITFLVTLSGVVIGGVGSAFWGLAAGALALFVQQYARPRGTAS